MKAKLIFAFLLAVGIPLALITITVYAAFPQSHNYHNIVTPQPVLAKVVDFHALMIGSTGKIVFASERDGDGEIYVMNPDGTAQTQLTNNSIGDLDPSLSYDGSKIAFESWRDGNGEIYIMNSNGTAQTLLTNNPAEDYDPSISPDGSKIVFTTNRDGNWEIYLMNSDGSNPINLTNSPASEDRVPSFSPDGTKIAFASDRDGDMQIFVMNVDGANPTNLTSTSDGYYPSFSPDGAKIIFISWRDGNSEVYTMNADGSDQTNLTNNPASDSFPCSFSPDGSRIAFTSYRDGDWEIYVMNSDGSNQTRLTNRPGMDRQPVWGPRSSSIYVSIPVSGGDFSSLDGTEYIFPQSTFTDTVIITHATRFLTNVPSLGSLAGADHFFDVTAVYSNTGWLAQPESSHTYTVTVRYTDAEKGPVIEETLALYYWDGDQWVKETSSVVDIQNNTLTATPSHFSLWAVMGETRRVYLPLVRR